MSVCNTLLTMLKISARLKSVSPQLIVKTLNNIPKGSTRIKNVNKRTSIHYWYRFNGGKDESNKN